MAGSDDTTIYRVREGFAVPGPGGVLRAYAPGALLSGSDKLATSHRALLEPVGDAVETTSAAPGTRRSLRLPSAVRLKQATEHQTGHAHKTTTPATPTGDVMPHALPPEDPNSPASPFAPAQPAAGVVADDVPAEQNKAGAPKASQVDEDGKKTSKSSTK